MTNCPDFCSVAKCEELENRISALEQALELLQASFEAHTNQDIPTAHNYNSNLKIDGSYQSNTLTLTVADQTSQDTATIQIPDSNVSVSLATDSANNTLKVFVEVGDQNDDETVTLPKSNLKLDGSFQESVLTLSVADGQSQDTATITIPIPEIPEIPEILEIPEIPEAEQHVKSNLKLDGIFQGSVLTLSVADGESQDTASIFIPIDDLVQTIFITEEIYMNCDQLENEFKDCCDKLTNLIVSSFNNLDNQLANLENALNVELDSLENAINNEVKQVYDQVTIDISGTAQGDYICDFALDDNQNTIPAYPVATSVEKTYTGKGFQGIQANLQIISDNLKSIHSDVCKAIEPIDKIQLEDLYQFCDDSGIERAAYPEGESGFQDYQDAIKAYLQTLLDETKYAPLINSATGDILLTAPKYWITNMLADFSLIQSRINNQKLCNLNFDEPDVVSIIASPKYLTNVDGKVLILHFVSEANYPKRPRGSSYRQIQIPGAKEAYDWDVDFANLRWLCGNQYAELVLNEYRATVSGWFESEGAANSFFNAVLNLTIGTEKNRKFPKHKFPRTDITSQITRPYRAFIESINDQGQAVCHVKYVPPIEPQNA